MDAPLHREIGRREPDPGEKLAELLEVPMVSESTSHIKLTIINLKSAIF